MGPWANITTARESPRAEYRHRVGALSLRGLIIRDRTEGGRTKSLGKKKTGRATIEKEGEGNKLARPPGGLEMRSRWATSARRPASRNRAHSYRPRP